MKIITARRDEFPRKEISNLGITLPTETTFTFQSNRKGNKSLNFWIEFQFLFFLSSLLPSCDFLGRQTERACKRNMGGAWVRHERGLETQRLCWRTGCLVHNLRILIRLNRPFKVLVRLFMFLGTISETLSVTQDT